MTPSQTGRSWSKLLLPVFSLLLAVVACMCVPIYLDEINAACIAGAPSGTPMEEIEACVQFVYAMCPVPLDESQGLYQAQGCIASAVHSYYSGAPMTPIEDYEGMWGDHPTTPTPTAQVLPPPPQSYCDGLALTSPLDGMPNGVATFYWNPPFNQSATFEIIVMDENHTLLATFPAGTSTNVSGDVSMAAIGGGLQLWVKVRAYLVSATCDDEHLIWRAAPDNSAPPVIPPPIRPH